MPNRVPETRLLAGDAQGDFLRQPTSRQSSEETWTATYVYRAEVVVNNQYNYNTLIQSCYQNNSDGAQGTVGSIMCKSFCSALLQVWKTKPHTSAKRCTPSP